MVRSIASVASRAAQRRAQPRDPLGARGLRDPLTARSLDAAGVIQAVFAGPPLVPNNLVNVTYPGHQFTTGGTQANTGCGTHNRIQTAGEKKNSGASQPGTPSNMTAYQYKLSRTGGLVRDPALPQASTRIHLINHRLENSGNTQSVASNILLGSKRANNPTHLHSVENYVINSLISSSRENTAYENDLGAASTKTNADTGNQVTWWDKANLPSLKALPTIYRKDGWLDSNGDVTGTPPTTGGKKKKTNTGSSTPVADGVFVDPTSIFLPRHLWLDYDVQANYSGAPGFVQNNANHERTQNGGAVTPNDQAVENTIQDFENSWKDNAFPADFTSSATYYTASWTKGSPYHASAENPVTIPTDT